MTVDRKAEWIKTPKGCHGVCMNSCHPFGIIFMIDVKSIILPSLRDWSLLKVSS